MARGNGSYMGQTVNPNSNVASGIWTVREAETYLRADKWPAQPTVPSAPSGTAGDGEVELTWTAPTGGSTPTDYIIQYSSDGGASWTTFSDGVSTATTATVTGLTNGTGYIFRIIAVNALGQGPAGSASGTITPAAAAPLNVSLLMHFNGEDASTSFVDSSSNALTVTAYGNAQISTAQSKFGGSSLFMSPGGGGYLNISHSGQFDFGTDDFTVEFWLRLSAPMTGSVFGSTYSTNPAFAVAVFTDGSLAVAANAIASWQNFTNAGVIVPLQWSHVAITRQGGVLRTFVDGTNQVPSGSSANTLPFSLAPGDPFEIGTANTPYTVDGYIDELRIVKGTAVYTANFTPPTAPFPDPLPAPSLLLHFDGTDGSSVITDSSPNNWSLTASGGAQISTAQSRFGGSSLAVGPDSAVTGTGTEPIVDFNGGPGTVEGWVYITTGVSGGYFGGFAGPQGASGTSGLLLGIVGTARVAASYLAAGVATSSAEFTLNEWHHLAYVLEADGVTLNIYVDGALAVTATAFGSHNLTGIVIGNSLVGTQVNFSGYIDEIRVTKSVVYPGPFTPPTAPF